MKHEIETQWMGKMQFNALVNGHTIVMDGPERSGGEDNGTVPKPLVLTALSGCSGMDVVALLRKQGLQVDDFNIKVEGELSKGTPVVYTAIQVSYEFKGPDSVKQAAIDAVNASQEKYCGVGTMLKKILPVTWKIVYNGEVVFSNAPTLELTQS